MVLFIHHLSMAILRAERNERYFIDFTEEKFNKFVNNIENVKLKEEWITCDVRPGRGEEKWLNLILQKN